MTPAELERVSKRRIIALRDGGIGAEVALEDQVAHHA